MVTLLIIADDFTGALDTGVKFAASGASVRVVTDYEYEFGRISGRVQVLVMDAETRHISSGEAYDRVYRIVKKAKQAGIAYIYKKTDSALRGNIGSELSAVLDASGSQVLHFLPAFPKMGRTTRRGVHYIDGVPVTESVFGKDPFEPVTCSDITQMIAVQSQAQVKVVPDGQVMALQREPGIQMPSHQPFIAVYDAETDEELQRIAAGLFKAGQLTTIAGCAGMAETLPELLGLTGPAPSIPDFIPGFLVACGSVNPITRGQLDYAEEHGFKRIRLTPPQKLEPGYFETEVGRAKVRELVETVKGCPLCILDTNDLPGRQGESETLAYAGEHGIALEELRVRIATTLGYLVKELVDGGVESTMLITGGDSLLGFMNQIQVYEMTPICEMAPGTVLSQFEIKGRTYEVISKSGGFGEKELLSELAEKILKGKKEMDYVEQL